MSPLAARIAEEIRAKGPLRFDRFMQLALYDAEFGYYRRSDHDPFGRSGDFYTASQLQPVFGRVIARAVEDFHHALGAPEAFTVVELGPGRGEMAHALSQFRYVPIEVGEELPESITGVVFSNEFFDALPVRLLDRDAAGWKERFVALSGDEFVFTPPSSTAKRRGQTTLSPQEHDPSNEENSRGQSGLSPLLCVADNVTTVELHEASNAWIHRIAHHLTRGYVLTIDYGYTTRESLRFPKGSLMSYRAHHASEDVLKDPGTRDITSHVPFDLLREEGERAGLRTESFETLSQFLVRLGERDQFAQMVEGGLHSMLKTLLYGMGETFRVLVQSRNTQHQ